VTVVGTRLIAAAHGLQRPDGGHAAACPYTGMRCSRFHRRSRRAPGRSRTAPIRRSDCGGHARVANRSSFAVPCFLWGHAGACPHGGGNTSGWGKIRGHQSPTSCYSTASWCPRISRGAGGCCVAVGSRAHLPHPVAGRSPLAVGWSPAPVCAQSPVGAGLRPARCGTGGRVSMPRQAAVRAFSRVTSRQVVYEGIITTGCVSVYACG